LISQSLYRISILRAAVVAGTLLCLLVPAFAQVATLGEPSDPDIDIISARLRTLYLNDKNVDADKFFRSQNLDGSWSDIDYADQSLNWAPLQHLARLQEMSVAYATEGSVYFQSPKMALGVAHGLEYWFMRKPTCKNWWYVMIGQQLPMERILILLKGVLPGQLKKQGADLLYDSRGFFREAGRYLSGRNPTLTGENLVWIESEQLVRGVLRNSSDDIAEAVAEMQRMLQISTNEGDIQPDYSFHQHGAQLYMGGYGLGVLKDSVTNALIVRGTRFAFAPAKIEILVNYLLQGTRNFIRGGMIDYGAIGREIARAGGTQEALGIVDVCDALALLKPEQSSIFLELKAHILGTGYSYSVIGHKHYWNSDFSTHQRHGYYTSVKMVSNRTKGTESINGENLKGFWIPYGTNYIVRRGTEYADIFPTWNWSHLPGVTAFESVPPIAGDANQPGWFVGGVTDNLYGASAMQLELEPAQSAGHALKAHKAWFFFDDEYVALGSGISLGDNSRVMTTVNQTLLSGTVLSDRGVLPPGQHQLKNPSWILHDSIGYLFPRSSSAMVTIGPKAGSWSSINSLLPPTPLENNIFALSLDHGQHPEQASYAYIVLPDVDEAKLRAYARHVPVKILRNDIAIQAVCHERLNLSQVVFYRPGAIDLLAGLHLEADQPCIVMLSEKPQAATKLTISSPRGPIRVNLSLSTVGAGPPKRIAVDLPGGERSGRSTSVSLQP